MTNLRLREVRGGAVFSSGFQHVVSKLEGNRKDLFYAENDTTINKMKYYKVVNTVFLNIHL